MAPIIPNPKKIKSFRTEAAFESWLRRSHARETELWLRIYKKGSGVPTVTSAQALDVALSWGWIDGIRKAFDERSFLQRYTPRRARSAWSQINREHVARLTAAGRMTPHGQRQVDAAKADGRWDAAYAPIRSLTEDAIPDDLRAAIEASPRARKTFRTLGRRNLVALVFRTNNVKTPAGRARKVAALVAMLERGETLVPQAPSRRRGAGPAAEMKDGTMKTSDASQGQRASELISKRIAELGDWRGATLSRMRKLVREADPDVVEEWKWVKPTNPGTPVWSHHGIICTGESYKRVVKLTFAKGASLKDPARLFNSSLEGNVRRAIDIHEGEDVDESAFKALVRQAVALNRSGKSKPSK